MYLAKARRIQIALASFCSGVISPLSQKRQRTRFSPPARTSRSIAASWSALGGTWEKVAHASYSARLRTGATVRSVEYGPMRLLRANRPSGLSRTVGLSACDHSIALSMPNSLRIALL